MATFRIIANYLDIVSGNNFLMFPSLHKKKRIIFCQYIDTSFFDTLKN